MSSPEKRLWTTCQKHLPKGVAAFRIENRAGPGMPDVAIVSKTGTSWVELKAPKHPARTDTEDLCIRAHLFGFSSDHWAEAHHDSLLSEHLIGQVPADKFSLSFAAPSYVRSTQSAWHARVYGVGGVSFFLEKPQGPSSYRLFSPYIDPGSGSLRLGLVCETRDLGVLVYALRVCAEMHTLMCMGAQSLRLDALRPAPYGSHAS